jgi:hypothetical protein
MTKRLLVFGDKTFRITVPDNATITFGPWSPPKGTSLDYRSSGEVGRVGTLRIYDGPKSTANIIAVFSGVSGFRDLDIGYEEMVAREEGAALWKSDEKGYTREEKGSIEHAWVDDPAKPKELTNGRRTKKPAAVDDIPF